ncbi:MAG: formate dehydrogenase accessory sulfurtransferase FdhD [Saprospiraceae bacterium]|nr:formate dehydrogenase accessory sulfurtransferase FdhD [Saprospiraceae bacterium]
MQGIQLKNAVKARAHSQEVFTDHVVIEEPLEIRIWDPENQTYLPLSVTMRTPGQDVELVTGLLFAEGIISSKEDILQAEKQGKHILLLTLSPKISIQKLRDQRSFLSTASCGICGKKHLGSVQQHSCYFPATDWPTISLKELLQLPQKLRDQQSLFELTGGIHAAGLFDRQGQLLYLREDVGRHNALDKLIGVAVHAGEVPWRENIVVLSGRIGFELVQKASMLGTPMIIAVGAPSSLAIETAEENGISLIGFTRAEHCNIYTGAARVTEDSILITNNNTQGKV